MIKLAEKIQINETQELFIFQDGLRLKEKSIIGNFYLKDKTYLYKDMQEKLEVRVYENFDEELQNVYYYDENSNKILLGDKQGIKEQIVINIQIEVDKNGNKTIDYINLKISDLNLALEIVKKANKYIKEVK